MKDEALRAEERSDVDERTHRIGALVKVCDDEVKVLRNVQQRERRESELCLVRKREGAVRGRPRRQEREQVQEEVKRGNGRDGRER